MKIQNYIAILFLVTSLIKAQIKPWDKNTIKTGSVHNTEQTPLIKKTELSGIYQGKGLFMHNPTNMNSDSFCIYKILVNSAQITDNIKFSAFKLDLGTQNIKKGDTVKVEIFYKNDCYPLTIHIDSGIISTAKIVSMNISDRKLNWQTNNERNKLVFEIEQYRWNKWVKIGEVDGVGTPQNNQYSFYAIPYSGENKMRVKQISEVYLSSSIKWKSTQPEVKFTIQKHPKEIQFTEQTMYEIFDSSGGLVKKGWAQTISYDNLPKGIYTLNYDNFTAELKL